MSDPPTFNVYYPITRENFILSWIFAPFMYFIYQEKKQAKLFPRQFKSISSNKAYISNLLRSYEN
jgi:hypothetical protein